MADPLSPGVRDALSLPERSRGPLPCTRVWLVLVGLTLATFLIGEVGQGGLAASLLVLGLALAKGWLVGDRFMGLAGLRGPWRWVIGLWLVVPGTLIATAFVLAA
jgi:cytochrome c oxidase subunit IV